MNILFISNDPNIFKEGTSARVRMQAYAAELEPHDGKLHILSRGQENFVRKDGPLVLHSVRVGRIRSPFVLLHHARHIIQKHRIVVVSAQDPFEHGWVAMKAVHRTPARLHLQVHTDFLTPWFTRTHIYRSPRVRMPLLNGIRRRIAVHVLPHADGIRTVSERVQSSLTTKFGSTIPVPSVIPIAVDATVSPKVELPLHNFTFALIAVGRLEPEKRIEDIIAAVARLKDAYPFLGLFIVGEGRERKRLVRMARSLKLSDKVIFLGARADARGLMQSAQCFIQASAYEGYGLTLIEAALSRVPIVTTDVGIVGEVFKGFEHVLADAVADPTNLAAHIAWLIEDQEARRALVLAAEARAREHLADTDSSPAAIMRDIMTTTRKLPETWAS